MNGAGAEVRVMTAVKVDIVRFVDEHQPGFVEITALIEGLTVHAWLWDVAISLPGFPSLQRSNGASFILAVRTNPDVVCRVIGGTGERLAFRRRCFRIEIGEPFAVVTRTQAMSGGSVAIRLDSLNGLNTLM